MKEYEVRRTGSELPVLEIGEHLWLEPAPVRAFAQMSYDDEALRVTLWAQEPNIRAEENGPLGFPCLDSCLEFFFSPMEGDSRYFNIEVNPNGCVYLGFGIDRYLLVRLLPEEFDPLKIETERTPDGWRAHYQVPYSFIRHFFPEFRAEPGKTMRANFYKCGDKTVQPHFISWNRVDQEQPDFHVPQHFGLLRLK